MKGIISTEYPADGAGAEDGSLYWGKLHGDFTPVLLRTGLLCLLMALPTVPVSDR